MSAIENTAQWLVDIGAYDIVIPFILTFTILYASLQKSKILGEDKKIQIATATTIGFLVVASIQLVGAIQNIILITVSSLLIGVLSLILAGSAGINPKSEKTKNIGMILGLITVTIAVLTITRIDTYIDISIIQNQVFTTPIIILIILINAVWWITRSTSSQNTNRRPTNNQTSGSTSQPATSKNKTEDEDRPENLTFKERINADDIDDIR